MPENRFNPFREDLPPRLLIEASAGTGKTYTLTSLWIRFIIEQKVQPEQLLVVTFTRRATRELRERILDRLRDSLAVLQKGSADGREAFFQDLIDFCRNRTDVVEILERAIRYFDRAKVLTIHGYCQRVLQEEAILTASPFDLVVDTSDSYIGEVVESIWREEIDRLGSSKAGTILLDRLMSRYGSPEKLLKNLKEVSGFPSVVIETGPLPDMESIPERYLGILQEWAAMWKERREELCSQIHDSHIKSAARYTDSRCSHLDRYIFDEAMMGRPPDALRFFIRSWVLDPKNWKNGYEPFGEDPFFDLSQELYDLNSEMGQVLNGWLRGIIKRAGALLAERRNTSDEASFDELLLRLYDALNHPVHGETLALRLRSETPVAMVDEFQDTDPVQYAIFDKIYPRGMDDSRLLMIGDPKQSIYRFRGADLYAYLAARKGLSEDALFRLDFNYRSDTPLVSAVNELFSYRPDPFLEKEILYSPVSVPAAQTGIDSVHTGLGESALDVVFTIDEGQNVSNLKELAFRWACDEVVNWIENGRSGTAQINGSSLKPNDIAILVLDNRSAERLKGMLSRRGVDAITYTKESVFESDEARILSSLFKAVLNPDNSTAVNNLLFSGLFGRNLAELMEMQKSEIAWRELVEMLTELLECWRERGVMAMIRRLLTGKGAIGQAAGFQRGERMITNLEHLAELCSISEREDRLDPAALSHWFERNMEEKRGFEDDKLLLESDRDLVMISTVHGSKGLEYPLVICPDLWSVRRPNERIDSRPIVGYYDLGKEYQFTANLENRGSEGRQRAARRSMIEECSEEVRKSYVALTRAKYKCKLFWGSHSRSHYSGLGALLLGRDRVERSIGEYLGLPGYNEKSEFGVEDYARVWRDMARRCHSITVGEYDNEDDEESVNVVPPDEAETAPLQLKKIELPVRIVPGKSIFSFTSLLQSTSAYEEADYEQWQETGFLLNKETVGEVSQTIFGFPKGASAGIVVHKLFEHPDFDFRDPSNYERIASEILDKYAFDPVWSPVLADMMRAVRGADFGSLRLEEVSPCNMIREMEFHLPSSPVSGDELINMIRGGPSNTSGWGSDLDIEGFLTGFVDLIVRFEGRYYILDYKSNWLGKSVEEYGTDSLAGEVTESGYDLQYHLYLLAVRRYLQSTLPDFEYDRHFGGVLYLFVRGMRQGSNMGVYRDRPDRTLLDLLEARIERGGGDV
ncbi:MAG: exodeoxyribonuclease V subunit beta [Balneolaceae bacterium]